MTELFTASPIMQEGEPQNSMDSIFNQLLKDRIIWLGSEVKDENANIICA
ncbi:ATP-dependent Clp protease proteolytic subunit, partial [Gardnerella vaginalis]